MDTFPVSFSIYRKGTRTENDAFVLSLFVGEPVLIYTVRHNPFGGKGMTSERRIWGVVWQWDLSKFEHSMREYKNWALRHTLTSAERCGIHNVVLRKEFALGDVYTRQR